MFKKTKQGIEIDSQAADKEGAPRFKGRSEATPKKFGKKKNRAAKAAKMMGRGQKGY